MGAHNINVSSNWTGLHTLTEPTADHNTTPNNLPPVPENSPELKAIQSNRNLSKPYTDDLKTSIESIKTYITEQVAPSPNKTQALNNLDLYVSNRLNRTGTDLKAIVLNAHRNNLKCFAEALHNPHIEQHKKNTSAMNLALGLGVCPEGESLNIYEQTTALHGNQQGFLGQVLKVKNTLIDQQLQQLVRHEASLFMGKKQAEVLEIHQVQALKNHVANQWGLVTISDKHASTIYQQQAGKMAEVLLQKTVTPAALARMIAQNLRETIIEKHPKIATGINAQHLDYDVLKQHIELEFGNTILLADCLGTSDDYATINVKTEEELSELVLEAFKAEKLIDPHLNTSGLLKEPTPQFHELLPQIERHRDLHAAHRTWQPAKTTVSYLQALAHMPTPKSIANGQDDERRKKQANRHQN